MEMQNAFQNLNWLAVIAAAVSAFILGGLWYSPLLFSRIWMKENGFTEESLRASNQAMTFGLSFVLSFIAAFFLAMFLGAEAGAGFGALAGFMAGFGWVFTYLGIIYLFESKTLKLFLVNALYSVVSLTLMGLIIGLIQ